MGAEMNKNRPRMTADFILKVYTSLIEGSFRVAQTIKENPSWHTGYLEEFKTGRKARFEPGQAGRLEDTCLGLLLFTREEDDQKQSAHSQSYGYK